MQKATSQVPKIKKSFTKTCQVSISHLSTTGCIRPDVEVPELSFGHNPRLPSASSGIDLQFIISIIAIIIIIVIITIIIFIIITIN